VMDQFCCDWSMPFVDPIGDVINSRANDASTPDNGLHTAEAERLAVTEHGAH
jgi:hypothetical protein